MTACLHELFDLMSSALTLLVQELSGRAAYSHLMCSSGFRQNFKDGQLSFHTGLCRDSVPWQARAGMFCPIVNVLGKCMATRYTAYSENLWRAAASVFNSIINSGLPAVNKAYFNPQDATPPTSSWACLAEVLEWFLLGKHIVAIDTATVAAVLDEPTVAEVVSAESIGVAAAGTPTSGAGSVKEPAIAATEDPSAADRASTSANAGISGKVLLWTQLCCDMSCTLCV